MPPSGRRSVEHMACPSASACFAVTYQPTDGYASLVDDRWRVDLEPTGIAGRSQSSGGHFLSIHDDVLRIGIDHVWRWHSGCNH